MQTGEIIKIFKSSKIPGKIFWLARILILSGILLAVIITIYLNEVGVPESIYTIFLKSLEKKGYKVSITNVKFVWYRGIVLDQPKIEVSTGNIAVYLEARTADIMPSFSSLFSKEPEIEKVKISGGYLQVFQTNSTGNNPQSLAINDINLVFRFPRNDICNFEITGKIWKIKISLKAQNINFQPIVHIITNSLVQRGVRGQSTGSADKISTLIAELKDWDFDIESRIDIEIKSDRNDKNLLRADAKIELPSILTKYAYVKDISGKITAMPLSGVAEKNHTANGRFIIGAYRSRNFSFEDAFADISIGLIDDKTKKLKLVLNFNSLKTKEFELKKTRNEFEVSGLRDLIHVFNSPVKFSGNAYECNFREFFSENVSYQGIVFMSDLTNKAELNIKIAFRACNYKYVNVDNGQISFLGTVTPGKYGDISGHLKIQAESLKATNIFLRTPGYDGELYFAFTNIFPAVFRGSLKFANFQADEWKARNGNITFSIISDLSDLKVNSSKLSDIFYSSRVSLVADMDETKIKDVEISNIHSKIFSDSGKIVIESINCGFNTGTLDLKGEIVKSHGGISILVDSSISPHELTKIFNLDSNALTNYLDTYTPFNVKIEISGNVTNISDPKILTNVIKELSYKVETKLPSIRLGKNHIQDVELNFNISKDSIIFDKLNFYLKTNNINANGVIALTDKSILGKFVGFVNPNDIINFLAVTNGEYVALISNTLPFEIKGEMKANFEDFHNLFSLLNSEQFYLRCSISATNFAFREKEISELRCGVELSKRILTVSNIELVRHREQAVAEKIIADFNTERVHLINARGTLSPSDITQAIGEDVYNALSPFKFGKTPVVKANGSVPMHGAIGDIVFEIFAPEVKWWRIKGNNVSTKVIWKDETVTLTNFYSDFYDGTLSLSLFADFSELRGTNLNYHAKITKVNVNSMLKDLMQKPQRLEGSLTGQLEIYSKSITNYHEWCGNGQATLEDGLIWDIPVFGIFSPVLNTISPGLGNSRANYATATFAVTNGVVATDNLEIRAKTIRMKYEGIVDFDKNIDARVEAELLRDVWLVGPAIRFLLKPLTKLFIYKVRGTLDKPVSEPLFIPRILLAPLHPFKTIKDFILPSNESTNDGKEKK